jgi:molecular chaperone HtpG
MTKQTLNFQAEVAQLLHLVTHSLYSNEEIFCASWSPMRLTPATSCASRRIEQRRPVRGRAQSGGARVSFDKDAKTLTITDNGIGMSAAGGHRTTWAPSPRAAPRSSSASCSGDQKADAQLIGQFGVGFYSGFIVADKITVESRRAGLPARAGRALESAAGAGDFEVETISAAARGTSVTLHLREDADDYASAPGSSSPSSASTPTTSACPSSWKRRNGRTAS